MTHAAYFTHYSKQIIFVKKMKNKFLNCFIKQTGWTFEIQGSGFESHKS